MMHLLCKVIWIGMNFLNNIYLVYIQRAGRRDGNKIMTEINFVKLL
jgi:hypothetical protein